MHSANRQVRRYYNATRYVVSKTFKSECDAILDAVIMGGLSSSFMRKQKVTISHLETIGVQVRLLRAVAVPVDVLPLLLESEGKFNISTEEGREAYHKAIVLALKRLQIELSDWTEGSDLTQGSDEGDTQYLSRAEPLTLGKVEPSAFTWNRHAFVNTFGIEATTSIENSLFYASARKESQQSHHDLHDHVAISSLQHDEEGREGDILRVGPSYTHDVGDGSSAMPILSSRWWSSRLRSSRCDESETAEERADNLCNSETEPVHSSPLSWLWKRSTSARATHTATKPAATGSAAITPHRSYRRNKLSSYVL